MASSLAESWLVASDEASAHGRALWPFTIHKLHSGGTKAIAQHKKKRPPNHILSDHYSKGPQLWNRERRMRKCLAHAEVTYCPLKGGRTFKFSKAETIDVVVFVILRHRKAFIISEL